jgi:hypothetical protein
MVLSALKFSHQIFKSDLEFRNYLNEKGNTEEVNNILSIQLIPTETMDGCYLIHVYFKRYGQGGE